MIAQLSGSFDAIMANDGRLSFLRRQGQNFGSGGGGTIWVSVFLVRVDGTTKLMCVLLQIALAISLIRRRVRRAGVERGLR